MEKVGVIRFGGYILPVYNSIDTPYFKPEDVLHLIGESPSKLDSMIKKLEADELQEVFGHGGLFPRQLFVNELGLYNMLSMSQSQAARGWKRIIHQELIDNRLEKSRSIIDQFDIWDEKYSDIYFDTYTGVMMRSVTVPGGDVEQIPYDEEED